MKRSHRDLVIVAVVTVLSYWLAVHLDVITQLLESVRRAQLHIDEIVFPVIVLLAGSAWFALRRWREFRAEKAVVRLRAEEALRESEAQFQSVIETAPSAIVCLSPAGRILEFNPEAEAVYGCQRKEVLGKDYLEQFVPDYARPKVAENIRKVLAGEPTRGYESPIRTADGTERLLEWNVNALEDHQGRSKGLIAIGQDITARKRIEEAYKESEARFRSLVDSAPGVILCLAPDGEILEFNPEAEKVYGRKREQVLGENYLELFLPLEARGSVRADMQKVIAGEPTRGYENPIKAADGAEYFFLWSVNALRDHEGRATGVVAIGQDVTKRRRAEEAVKESEQRLRFVTNQFPAILWTTDTDLRFTFAVGAGLRALDLDQGQLIGMTLTEYVGTDDPEFAPLFAHRRALGGESTSFQQEWQGIAFEVQIEPLRNADGDVVGAIGVALDVTEHKKTEDALRDSEERFRTIFHSAGGGIVYATVDGKLIDTNPAFQEMLGYSGEELSCMTVQDITHPDDVKASVKVMQDMLTGRTEHGGVEKRYLRKDGGIVWSSTWVSAFRDVSGKVTSLIAVVDDITERKKAEEDLRESRERFRTIFESAGGGIAHISRQGKFSDTNRAFQEMLGYSRDELRSMTVKDITHPDDVDVSLRMIEGLVTEKHKQGRLEKRCHRKDGGVIWVSVWASTFRDISGKVASLIAVVQDITDRKKMEEGLRESREILRNYASRLQSVREEERASIAREIHDEFGQLLTGVKMDLSWLLEKMPKRRKDLIQRGRSTVGLVDSLLNSVRAISSELRPSVLDDLGLEAAIEAQAQDFTKRTGCECELNLDGADLGLDRDRDTAVFRILQEALTNVARHARASYVEIELRTSNGELLLDVKDDGQGIVEGEISSPQSLGLMGMRERAGALGGRIDFQRLPEGGTLVMLTMPLSAEKGTGP